MKKPIVTLFIVFSLFNGCTKEKDEINQLRFSVKNLISLIGKSQEYIRRASPGFVYELNPVPNTLIFAYYGDENLGDCAIGYAFEDNKCVAVSMANYGSYNRLKYIMGITEDELGKTDNYGLDYYDGENLYEETFSTYDALWQFVVNNDLREQDIELMGSIHKYKGFEVGALGYFEEETSSFVITISITPETVEKSTYGFSETSVNALKTPTIQFRRLLQH
jgi:hypothetical protein